MPVSEDNNSIVRDRMQDLDIYHSYMRSKFLSLKVSSYFQVYEELLSRYRNKPVVFVEIGILNGGSLFMWRDFLGSKARIIGVDLNPQAKRWEKDGFEIHIGNQSKPEFWEGFFASVGEVDVILDDGGHTNDQQVVTAHMTLPHIQDGGMLIVEDVHTSYAREFGNPSRYSFIEYCKYVVDSINGRFPGLRSIGNASGMVVWSVAFYESVVCLHVDRQRCFTSSLTSNNGQTFNAEDFRHHQSSVRQIAEAGRIGGPLATLARYPLLQKTSIKLLKALSYVLVRWQSRKLGRYFR